MCACAANKIIIIVVSLLRQTVQNCFIVDYPAERQHLKTYRSNSNHLFNTNTTPEL